MFVIEGSQRVKTATLSFKLNYVWLLVWPHTFDPLPPSSLCRLSSGTSIYEPVNIFAAARATKCVG